jgi:preprotein translocase subunit SecG
MTPRRKPGAISLAQIVPILFTVALLVGVILMKSRCSSAVGNLFHAIETAPAVDAGSP